ncbi:unnamed protein product [Rangifer tarandus platyrhynchus]|uniref:Uncharacterized protein n=1 Tax=Rangifer tarandus platyrhynchus TaxID=3082113 RepID=A0ABN8YQI6_RANTA|nr:unnamed protein product [Rangifer tarandus platyrhynchus]
MGFALLGPLLLRSTGSRHTGFSSCSSRAQQLWHTLSCSMAGGICNAGDPVSILGLGSSPRGGNGNPLQYSCLENSMDRGAWWATVHGIVKSWTEQLSISR